MYIEQITIHEESLPSGCVLFYDIAKMIYQKLQNVDVRELNNGRM